MRLGLFGGTFNPIHNGHLRSAVEIRDTFSLDQVLFLPAAVPPHKGREELLPFARRLRMVRLAVAGQKQLRASGAEEKHPGKSYTIRTVRYFDRFFSGKAELFFIVGLDAFLEIPSWKEYRKLFNLCHFIVMDRPGYRKGHLEDFLYREISPDFRSFPRERRFLHPGGRSVFFVSITRLEISSTLIRSLRKQERSIRYLIPEAVEQYIMTQGLYGAE
jgi:nicotinate-nucleotide adenylyltransferase